MEDHRRAAQPPYDVLVKKFNEVAQCFDDCSKRFMDAVAKYRLERDSEGVRIESLKDAIALYKTLDVESQRMRHSALQNGAPHEANAFEATRRNAAARMSELITIARHNISGDLEYLINDIHGNDAAQSARNSQAPDGRATERADGTRPSTSTQWTFQAQGVSHSLPFASSTPFKSHSGDPKSRSSSATRVGDHRPTVQPPRTSPRTIFSPIAVADQRTSQSSHTSRRTERRTGSRSRSKSRSKSSQRLSFDPHITYLTCPSSSETQAVAAAAPGLPSVVAHPALSTVAHQNTVSVRPKHELSALPSNPTPSLSWDPEIMQFIQGKLRSVEDRTADPYAVYRDLANFIGDSARSRVPNELENFVAPALAEIMNRSQNLRSPEPPLAASLPDPANLVRQSASNDSQRVSSRRTTTESRDLPSSIFEENPNRHDSGGRHSQSVFRDPERHIACGPNPQLSRQVDYTSRDSSYDEITPEMPPPHARARYYESGRRAETRYDYRPVPAPRLSPPARENAHMARDRPNAQQYVPPSASPIPHAGYPAPTARSEAIPSAIPRSSRAVHHPDNRPRPCPSPRVGNAAPHPDVQILRDPTPVIGNPANYIQVPSTPTPPPTAGYPAASPRTVPYPPYFTGAMPAPCAPPPYPTGNQGTQYLPSTGYPHPIAATQMPAYAQSGPVLGSCPPHADWALIYRFKNGEIKNLNFKGDFAKYRHWRREVERHLREAGIYDAQTVIDVLINNSEGRPKELIEQISNSGNQSPDAALACIWDMLERKYGSPEQASEALHQQVNDFKPVQDSRSEAEKNALENLLVLCNKILLASKTSASSAWYTSGTGISLLCQKTPKPFQDRWRKEHTRLMEARKPITLEAFTNVFQRYVSEVTNPAFRELQPRTKTRALLTTTSGTDSKTPRKERSTPTPEVSSSKASSRCLMCSSQSHTALYRCYEFKRLSNAEKWSKVRLLGICHRCLAPGHKRDQCPKQWNCLGCDSSEHNFRLCTKSNSPTSTERAGSTSKSSSNNWRRDSRSWSKRDSAQEKRTAGGSTNGDTRNKTTSNSVSNSEHRNTSSRRDSSPKN